MIIIPCENNMEIPVKDRDEQFMKLQEMIELKRQYLLNKQRKLYKITKHNQFLEDIKNDYQRYNKYIVTQKQDQLRALQMLDEYIKDLTVSGKLTKNNLEDAKEEQNKILNEVRSIKKSLDEIIKDTHEVQDTLNQKNSTV